jgi:hypothetical protein
MPALLCSGCSKYTYMKHSTYDSDAFCNFVIYLEPQPRSSTTFAGFLPSAARCWLIGWSASRFWISSDSSFTTAAVCAASGLSSRGLTTCLQ